MNEEHSPVGFSSPRIDSQPSNKSPAIRGILGTTANATATAPLTPSADDLVNYILGKHDRLPAPLLAGMNTGALPAFPPGLRKF